MRPQLRNPQQWEGREGMSLTAWQSLYLWNCNILVLYVSNETHSTLHNEKHSYFKRYINIQVKMNFSRVETIEELKQCFTGGDGSLHGVTGNEFQRQETYAQEGLKHRICWSENKGRLRVEEPKSQWWELASPRLPRLREGSYDAKGGSLKPPAFLVVGLGGILRV